MTGRVPWKCPGCRKTYSVPSTDGLRLCPKCTKNNVVAWVGADELDDVEVVHVDVDQPRTRPPAPRRNSPPSKAWPIDTVVVGILFLLMNCGIGLIMIGQVALFNEHVSELRRQYINRQMIRSSDDLRAEVIMTDFLAIVIFYTVGLVFLALLRFVLMAFRRDPK